MRYVIFDPEASDESVYYSDVWDDTFEDAWDGGHVEIIDYRCLSAAAVYGHRQLGRPEPLDTGLAHMRTEFAWPPPRPKRRKPKKPPCWEYIRDDQN